MVLVLRPHLKLVKAGDSIPLHTPLQALGLTSMAAINLLLDLEQTLGVVFPDTLLNEETFRTAGSLTQVVTTLLAEEAAAS